jgi:hypothetical protein
MDGWADVTVPRYDEHDRAFEDAVAGRLFALNQRRGRELSKLAGPGPKKIPTPRDRSKEQMGGTRRAQQSIALPKKSDAG